MMTNTPKRVAWCGAVTVFALCLACPFDRVDHCCLTDLDCDDGLFCNGVETCDGYLCQPGEPPCGVGVEGCPNCDEEFDSCVDPWCIVDADCDDGLFCNGSESCSSACECVVGAPPCEEGFVCIEEVGQCIDPAVCAWCDSETGICTDGCVADDVCDDGFFCNGVEFCESCVCHSGTPPCHDGGLCNEVSDTCDE